jgi:egghead protein (zeste-white 4 protein)
MNDVFHAILWPVVLLLDITYLYFWIIVIHARRNKHIDTSRPSNTAILAAERRAMRRGNPSLFTIQITTRGGSIPTVERGILNVIDGVVKYPALASLVRIEVITESADDINKLCQLFPDTPIPITPFLLPADYETPAGTKLKARALHYMVEQHRKHPTNSYVVHYDEESVFTADNLARLVTNLMTKPIGISEGPISYALDWDDSHPMCRTMESNRPFGCHECYFMMTNPAPLHLHGSNLVIQEKLENQIGWDIGLYKENPLIAEDLVFGLMAYLKFGGDVFGWHGVEMIEQPPFTIKSAYKQRERWVMGALQGVNHVRSLDGWSTIPRIERWKIQGLIRLRVFTYGIGLPVSIISLLAVFGALTTDYVDFLFGTPIDLHLSLFAIPGLLMWLGASQIGLHQNLSYTGYTKWQKLIEHIRVLCLTPFSGMFDTAGPFMAIVKWNTGKKTVGWIPTPKLVGQEYGDNEKLLGNIASDTIY